MPNKQFYKSEMNGHLGIDSDNVSREMHEAYLKYAGNNQFANSDWLLAVDKMEKEYQSKLLRYEKYPEKELPEEAINYRNEIASLENYVKYRQTAGRRLIDRDPEKLENAQEKYAEVKRRYDSLSPWQKFCAWLLPASLNKNADLRNKVNGYKEALADTGVNVKKLDETLTSGISAVPAKEKVVPDPEKAKERLPQNMKKVYESVKGEVDFTAENWIDQLNDCIYRRELKVMDERKALGDFKEAQREAFRKEQAALKAKIEEYDKTPAAEKMNFSEKIKEEHYQDVRNLQDLTFFLDDKENPHSIPNGQYRFVELHDRTMSKEDVEMLRKYNLAEKYLGMRDEIRELKEFRDNYAEFLRVPVDTFIVEPAEEPVAEANVTEPDKERIEVKEAVDKVENNITGVDTTKEEEVPKVEPAANSK